MSLPNLHFYTTAGLTLSALEFGSIFAGSETEPVNFYLWNNKNDVGLVVDSANNPHVAALDSNNSKLADYITQGWVLARSSGITNPDGILSFFDDQQLNYTPITDIQDLQVGVIPNNCGRSIFLKVRAPADAVTNSNVQIQVVGGNAPNLNPLPYFFNRAFGDGVIQENVADIFPAYYLTQINTYSISVILSGVFTGGIPDRNYLVEIVTGGTPGVATYRSSSDNGGTYSSTLTSATTGFTNLLTSVNVSEGIQLTWVGGRLSAGDKWRIHADNRPFQVQPGASNALIGYIGSGNAFVANNRVYQTTPSVIALTAATRNFLFFGVDGTFTISQSNYSAQSGKLLMGWWDTDTLGVTSQGSLFNYLSLGLDAYDDFLPMWSLINGRNWYYFQGKFKKFNQTIYLPGLTTLIGSLSLTAGITNYVEIDPLYEAVRTVPGGFTPDNIPLFEIGVGTNFINGIIDRRARVGLVAPSLSMQASLTTGSVGAFATLSSNLADFVNRAFVRKLVVTPNGGSAGYTITFHDTSAFTNMEYQAGNSLPSPFTDSFPWFHEDKDNAKQLHAVVINAGVTQSFNFLFDLERFA
jgi:hypothetical protein